MYSRFYVCSMVFVKLCRVTMTAMSIRVPGKQRDFDNQKHLLIFHVHAPQKSFALGSSNYCSEFLCGRCRCSDGTLPELRAHSVDRASLTEKVRVQGGGGQMPGRDSKACGLPTVSKIFRPIWRKIERNRKASPKKVDGGNPEPTQEVISFHKKTPIFGLLRHLPGRSPSIWRGPHRLWTQSATPWAVPNFGALLSPLPLFSGSLRRGGVIRGDTTFPAHQLNLHLMNP